MTKIWMSALAAQNEASPAPNETRIAPAPAAPARALQAKSGRQVPSPLSPTRRTAPPRVQSFASRRRGK